MDKTLQTQFKAMACPHCEALVAINPGQMDRVHKCPKCQKTFLGKEALKPSSKTKNKKFEDLQLAGRQLGNYLLQQMIGHGACGAVYRAQDVMLKRTVAIKVLPPSVSQQDEVSLKRFLQEAQLAAQLLHPNVVQIYYISHEDGIYYICMEFVDGGNLTDRLHGGRWISQRRAMNYMAQASEALRVAHQRGILHRDIKPANLMLTTEGVVKVADFGLAKLQGAEVNLTQERRVVGTPQYMSPEQCRGEPATMLSDIYALGVTFYHALTGTPPYMAESLMGVAYKHIHDPVPDPRDRRPPLQENIAKLIMRCMAKKPADRFPDAEALKLACESILVQTSDDATGSSAGMPLPSVPPEQTVQVPPELLTSNSQAVVVQPDAERSSSMSLTSAEQEAASPLAFFGLNASPFQVGQESELFFENAGNKQALESLIREVEIHAPLVVLTGPNGSGKTVLINQLVHRLTDSVRCFHLPAGGIQNEPSPLLLLGQKMEFSVPNETKGVDVIQALKERQQALASSSQSDLVIIDNIETLSSTLNVDLKLLCEFVTQTKRMSILLTGRDNLPAELSAAGIALPLVHPEIIKLEPFNPDEMQNYLQERLKHAGVDEKALHFTRAAHHAIHHYSRGWPGRANVISHNAMILAGSLGDKRITGTLVVRAMQKPSFVIKSDELPTLEDEQLGIFSRPDVVDAIKNYHSLQPV